MQPAPAPLPFPPPAPYGASIVVGFGPMGTPDVLLRQGTANRATLRPITADDPVRVASVSKFVTALGVMRLVEAGVLDLDADVSRYLGWRLRSPHHPRRVITLAQLLGHRSGLTDRIDYILPLDADLESVLADADGWDAGRPPGGDFVYANINFPVVAAAMEGATGERFDALMQRLVFAPLGIQACFNWSSCPADLRERAITLYRPNGDVARDDVASIGRCPVVAARDGDCDLSRYRLAHNGASFSPQGGLRISANGLARIGQMWLRGGDGFLTRRSLDRLARSQPVRASASAGGEGGEGSFFCRYGLAVQRLATRARGCRDDVFGDGRTRIGHAGDAYSLRSGIWLDLAARRGTVFFVTGVEEVSPPGRYSAFTAAEEWAIETAGLRFTRARSAP